MSDRRLDLLFALACVLRVVYRGPLHHQTEGSTMLHDRLDAVGWFDGPVEEKVSLVFKWMQDATEKINWLEGQVDRLQEEVRPA